jgi:NADPH-dependent 2,4-dienoyl-CoA reductase/sulfur reductase-like enzyme
MAAGSSQCRIAWRCSALPVAGDDSIVAWRIDIGAAAAPSGGPTGRDSHNVQPADNATAALFPKGASMSDQAAPRPTCWPISAPRRRVLIVGGVAGGASCAARLRRLDESVAITVFDRGPVVAFANCGLPYYVGNVIQDERALLVASPDLFRQRFQIEVYTNTEVTHIDRQAREIIVRDVRNGRSRAEPYDALVLSPGATPIRPPLSGVELDGVFAIRTIPDSRRIRAWIDDRRAQTAVIVGGGFIGLEMAENLIGRNIAVTVLEKLPQVMPPLDPEIAVFVSRHLAAHGVALHLGDGLSRIEEHNRHLMVISESGAQLPADLVILAIGVRPDSTLARDAGLSIGLRGGIVVDEQMRTSDPRIWAIGDAVEVPDVLTGQETVLPLAGPAHRQGRVAAESIAGRATRFRGVQATAVVGAMGLTMASTGASEKGLRRAGSTSFEKVYLHPGHHAGYYPGARPIHLKLLFSRPDGRILGAQAVGHEGVEKRIDVIAIDATSHLPAVLYRISQRPSAVHHGRNRQ